MSEAVRRLHESHWKALFQNRGGWFDMCQLFSFRSIMSVRIERNRDMITDYILNSETSHFLAKFPIVVGKGWTGEGGGGEHDGWMRNVHVELLHSTAPSLPEYGDMIMYPEGDSKTLSNLTSVLYSGKYVQLGLSAYEKGHSLVGKLPNKTFTTPKKCAKQLCSQSCLGTCCQNCMVWSL